MRRPAKKRKSTKKKATHRRKRSVSGIIGKGDIMNAVGLIAGGLAARELSNIAQTNFVSATMTSKQVLTYTAIAQIGVGFILPHYVKNSFVKAMCDGAKVIGGVQLMVDVGVISGVGSAPGRKPYLVNGTSKLNAISGKGDMMAINGKGDMMAVNGSSRAKSQRSFGNHA